MVVLHVASEDIIISNEFHHGCETYCARKCARVCLCVNVRVPVCVCVRAQVCVCAWSGGKGGVSVHKSE